MKVSLKGDNWIFKFDKTTISCKITDVNSVYTITFKINDQIVKINTLDLDQTFLSLENFFNSNPISSYR